MSIWKLLGEISKSYKSPTAFYQSYEYMGFEESNGPTSLVMQNSSLLAPHHSFLLPRENQFSTVL